MRAIVKKWIIAKKITNVNVSLATRVSTAETIPGRALSGILVKITENVTMKAWITLANVRKDFKTRTVPRM